MYWADYRDGSKKAKAHLGFNINHSIPSKIFLTDGKVTNVLRKQDTLLVRRVLWIVIINVIKTLTYGRLKENTLYAASKKNKKIVIETNSLKPGSIVFYDSIVLLGTPNVNQTEKPVRLVGYCVEGKEYWVATDRHDLAAEDIASIYKLRWNIEIFLGWWKRHLKVYHLIARSQYGLMVQILAGLITYLLLSIYCHNNFRPAE